jgi:hypothetical protein
MPYYYTYYVWNDFSRLSYLKCQLTLLLKYVEIMLLDLANWVKDEWI